MADLAPESDFECPNCHAMVQPDWHACPNCGVEFDPPEGAVAPAPAIPPPAYDELSAVDDAPTPAAGPANEIIIRDLAAPVPAPSATDDPLVKLEREIHGELGKISSTAEHLVELEREIKNELGKIRSMASPTVIVPLNLSPSTPSAVPALPAPAAKHGGLVSLLGIVLSLLGVGGVLLATNWDTMVLGASQNTVGATQLIGINGTAVLAALGLIVLVVTLRREKRKHQRAL